jgi:hypothetical protein
MSHVKTDHVIYKTDDLIASDIDAYLNVHQHKSLLRFITCGSVDDGKSTLIGRLLYDSKMIFEDQLATLQSDSKRMGRRAKTSTLRCLLTVLQPSESKASRSTSPTGFSPQRSGNSSSPIARAMNNIHGIW